MKRTQGDFLKLLIGHRATQALFAASRLGIPDLLRDGPKSTAELAQLTATNEPALARLMRVLLCLDVVVRAGDERFALSEDGALFLSDHPQTLRYYAIWLGSDWYWSPWADFLETLRTGEPAFDRVNGAAWFDYLNQNPEAADTFNRAMTVTAGIAGDALSESFDLSRYKTFVDVGGGSGKLLARVLAKNPNLEGILFDLPRVVDEASKYLERLGLRSRVELVSGSFFESVPKGGDVYFLRHIVHDWGDAEVVKILTRCREAMRPDAKLLIMERMEDPEQVNLSNALTDLDLMVMLRGARERTRKEFHDLLARSGFAMESVTWTRAERYIIEARPAAAREGT